MTWMAGHGQGRSSVAGLPGAYSGDFCCVDGKVRLADLVGIWKDVDKNHNYPRGAKKGSLTIITDVCYSGSWCEQQAWNTATLRGLGGGGER